MALIRSIDDVNNASDIPDHDDIIEEKNQFKIGQWRLLYNGQNNHAKFIFTPIEPVGLKISISDSTGWVRFVKPLDTNTEAGIYSVRLGVRSLTEKAESTYTAYVFSLKDKVRYEKHSQMTLLNGSYSTRLHLGNAEQNFWIGFETTDESIDFHISHIKIELIPIAKEIARLASDCQQIVWPLVATESKSERYQKVKHFNEVFQQEIKRRELEFLLEYACSLRQIEMSDTCLGIIKYLTVRYAELELDQKTILEDQIRSALLLTHDEELIELVCARCPELIFRLDINSDMFGLITGLGDCEEMGNERNIIQSGSSLYTSQENPALLSRLLKQLLREDPHYSDKHPQIYGVMANIFASRLGCEARYCGLLNKYFESHSLSRLAKISFESDICLSSIEFDQRPNVEQGPLVSVVMSAFNAASTIRYAAHSVLGQTYRNLELLICDDGSSDNTIELVQQLASEDSRVRVFKSKANQGTYNIRNDMITECRGEFITFQDSDDLSLPIRIQEQLSLMLDDNALLTFTHWLRIRETGQIVVFHDGKISRFCVVSAMAHRSVFERLPAFRSSYIAADTEFYENAKNLLGMDNILIDKRPLILGLWSQASLTRQKNLEAEHNGFVASTRRAYSDIAARQRILGEQVVTDSMINGKLQSLGIYRKPCGFEAL